MSGGVDSALTAAVAVDALGADRVHCVMMPSPYTSEESRTDASAATELLGCRLDEINIGQAMGAFDSMLSPLFGDAPADTTEENIQARSRGLALMGLSNKTGAMVVSTGNKSEMSVGYATLYGDMCGAIAPIGDLWKMDVFRMAQRDGAIPETTVHAAPSAELRADQKDEDSLPPYAVLDAILDGLIVVHQAPENLVSQGHDEATVQRVVGLLDRNEFKRRQAAPVLRVSRKALGMGRRYPLAWRRGF